MNKPFAIFWKSAGYIWSISPVGVLVYLGLIVLQGAIPGLLVFYTKSIVERTNVDVMRKAASFTDLRPYEDPAFYDTFYVENVSRIVERRS